MTDALNEKQREAIMGSIPAGRMGTGAEIASAVAYLASVRPLMSTDRPCT